MIYPPRISAFSDDNNSKIGTNISSVLFNTQVKALGHEDHLCTFRNYVLASLPHHTEDLKVYRYR